MWRRRNDRKGRRGISRRPVCWSATVRLFCPLLAVEDLCLADRDGARKSQFLESLMAITKYSVDDYEEMIRLGVITERDRVELIWGEIVAKMAIEPRHSTCVKGLSQLLTVRVAGRAVVGVQNPIRLPDSEPEPDISLVRPPKERYLTRNSEPADIFLVVEVADSSLEDDRNFMLRLYAESRIQEFGIANLRDDCLEVYRGPQPDGTYQEMRVLQRGQSTDIVALPGFTIAVDEVL
jgi:Uma2 family endonuclease